MMSAVVVSVILGLLVNEVCDFSPWLAKRLMVWAAQRWDSECYAADELAEEWCALIDSRPGKLFKLATALFFAVRISPRVTLTWASELHLQLTGTIVLRPHKFAAGAAVSSCLASLAISMTGLSLCGQLGVGIASVVECSVISALGPFLIPIYAYVVKRWEHSGVRWARDLVVIAMTFTAVTMAAGIGADYLVGWLTHEGTLTGTGIVVSVLSAIFAPYIVITALMASSAIRLKRLVAAMAAEA